jgi:DNA-binding NarL/FixJ family response regulator
MIRILIADDHRLVRRGIRDILGTAADITVMGECACADEIFAAVRQAVPDVLLLDMSMPGLSGIELIKQLVNEFALIRIVVLSMHNEGQFAASALREGAHGYVTKDADPEVLLQAVRKVAAGGKFIDPVLVDALIFDKPNPAQALDDTLTDRELQVLRLVVAGKSLNAIADEVHLSPKTISSHKTRIMQKLGVSNNADLVRYALRKGLGKP